MSLDKYMGIKPKANKELGIHKLARGLKLQKCSNCGKKQTYLPRNEGVSFRTLCNACRAREYKMMKEEEEALFE